MNSETLRQLLCQRESLKPDFKREFYKISHGKPNVREMEWGEFIKDILALTNGNVEVAGQTGYLIIGAADELRPDGTRQLYDVGNIELNAQQILEKVNSCCHPPLADIRCDIVALDGIRLLVISIPPSPHLHETTRPIKTKKNKQYPENSVFIRRGEGIYLASIEERQVILADKQRAYQPVVPPEKPAIEEQESQRPPIGQSPLFSPPRLPKGAVGRETETSALLEALAEPDNTIIWIGGISGIGKTHLAGRLYEKVSQRGGCQPLWVDCKKRSVTLEVLLDALTEVSGDPDLLRLIQDPLVQPAERVEQVFQRFMELDKVALFLDDYHLLEDLDERHRLDELIIQAASYCQQTKIILVGRVRPSVFDNPGLRGAFLEYPVEGLAVEYIKEYLAIPDLTDEQAHTIWEKCASGTPMAMSIFSTVAWRRSLSELLTLPIWDIANTIPQWLEPVMENLTSSELACLQAASVFPADIPFKALEYVYGGDDFQPAIYGLQDKGLLDHKPGSDRWSVWHDIIQKYVSEKKIAPLVRNELEQRLAEYYACFILENVQKPERLRSESANILGVMNWCRRKQHEMSMTILLQQQFELEESTAIQITHSFGGLAFFSGNLEWAEELYGEVSELARVKGHLIMLTRALAQLAHLARVTDNMQLAIRRYEEVINVGRAVGEAAWDTLVVSYNHLGGLLFAQSRNQYPLAERYLLEGLQIAEKSKKYLMTARIVNNLITIYSYQDEFEKAYDLYCKERVNLSSTALATLLVGIAPFLTAADRFAEARRCFQEARKLFEEKNNTGGIAYTWRLQGQWYWKQDKLKLAEESFQKEERLRRLVVEKDKLEMYHLRQALQEQHWFYLQTNQLDKAAQCRTKYQATQSKPDGFIPQMLGREAAALIDQGAYQHASQLCREAMAIFQEQGNEDGCAWIKRVQGDILAAQGQLEAALQLYEEELKLRIRLDESKYTAEALECLAEFYLRQMRDVEQARKYLERAQQEYRLVDKKKASAVGKRLRALRTQ